MRLRLPLGIRWHDACTGILSLTLLGQVLSLFMGFELEPKINLVDLSSLLLTLFLAIYIPGWFARQLQSRRYEEELLITRLQQIESVVLDIRQRVQNGTAPAKLPADRTQQLLAKFTALNQQIDLANELLLGCNLSDLRRTALLVQFEELVQDRGELQDLATGESFTPRRPFSFAPSTARAIDIKVHQMRLQCQRLILSVNRES